jgi:hypothetical protein
MNKLAATIAAMALAFSLAGLADAAPQCKTGGPCGNTCIAKGKTCHISAVPHCTTGKPCGNSCIKKTDVCHK